MEPARLVLLIPIFSVLGLFLTTFGIFYLRNKERMGMIERGMDPRLQIDKPGSRNYVLTAGLLLIGCGVGLFIAFLTDTNLLSPGTNSFPVYCSLIAIFGGLGLLTAYFVDKRDTSKA